MKILMKLIKLIRETLKKSGVLVRVVKKFRLFRYFNLDDWKDFKKIKLFWTVEPYTTVGYFRLNNAYRLAREIAKKNIPGDFVECGTWKGGCIAAMAWVSENTLPERKIWLFDSFSGLPEPDSRDGNLAREFAAGRSSGKLKPINECAASVDDAKEIFNKLKLNMNNVRIVVGWLQDTLPLGAKNIQSIAILRLDVDWYASTKICLEYLYKKVTPGGYIILDDYGHWEGCRRAVDEFLKKHNIHAKLKTIDYTGRYFQKS